jgi:hypothetical protein
MFARIRVDLRLTVAYVNSMLTCGMLVFSPQPTEFTEMLYRQSWDRKKRERNDDGEDKTGGVPRGKRAWKKEKDVT